MEDGQRVYVEEVRIEKLAEEINVYNLEVDEWHTYFVGARVLVHNKYGESGTQTMSTTVGKNGTTERFDVENPKPGVYEGNMHYHEPNNEKWYYDFDKEELIDDNGNIAPKYIQKVLSTDWAKKAIKKGKKYLGEN